MLKRELKVNRKSFLTWTSVCLVLFLAIFLLYPSITNNNQVNLNDLLKAMPENVLKMFNMDIVGIDSAFGWIKSEGYVFLLILTGLFASIMGSNILLKEESEKTIEFLYAKPITRNKIVTSKIMCGIIYVISMIVVIAIFNFIGLSISGSFNQKEYLLISLAPILACIPIFLISMFISTFFNKTKKTMGISMGFVFLSYFLLIFSQMSSNVEFLKYLSIYSLTNLREIVGSGNINISWILISLLTSIISGWLVYYNYNKKELI